MGNHQTILRHTYIRSGFDVVQQSEFIEIYANVYKGSLKASLTEVDIYRFVYILLVYGYIELPRNFPSLCAFAYLRLLLGHGEYRSSTPSSDNNTPRFGAYIKAKDVCKIRTAK